VAARNAHLLERIRALKAEHPFWGYRRIWAHLRYVDGLVVNQSRRARIPSRAGLEELHMVYWMGLGERRAWSCAALTH